MKKILFTILIGILMMFISSLSKANVVTDSLKQDVTIAQVLDNFQGNVFSVINDLKPEAKRIFQQQCKTVKAAALAEMCTILSILITSIIAVIFLIYKGNKDDWDNIGNGILLVLMCLIALIFIIIAAATTFNWIQNINNPEWAVLQSLIK